MFLVVWGCYLLKRFELIAGKDRFVSGVFADEVLGDFVLFTVIDDLLRGLFVDFQVKTVIKVFVETLPNHTRCKRHQSTHVCARSYNQNPQILPLKLFQKFRNIFIHFNLTQISLPRLFKGPLLRLSLESIPVQPPFPRLYTHIKLLISPSSLFSARSHYSNISYLHFPC